MRLATRSNTFFSLLSCYKHTSPSLLVPVAKGMQDSKQGIRLSFCNLDMRPQNGMFLFPDNWNKRIRAGLEANCYDYDKNKETTRVISLIGQLHLR